jgi:hypothetical protein
MYNYIELTDRFYYDNRLEKLNQDGLSESPALINVHQLDCVYRTKYKGQHRDVFLIVFKFKHDEFWSYCMRFISEYKRDENFNRIRRKLIKRNSIVKRK